MTPPEVGEAALVFVMNFAQIYLRTHQVYHVTKGRTWSAFATGGLIASAWLLSTWLGLKGIKEASVLVVGAFVVSNATAAAFAVHQTNRKNDAH